MPVYSMTGYASVQHSTGTNDAPGTHKSASAGQLGLEIRSVNSRFLDLSFRLPDDLRQFEPPLRELIIAKVKRGKVELRVFIETGALNVISDPTPKLLQRLNAVQDNVKAWLPDALALTVADAIRLSSSEPGSKHDWSGVILPLADEALRELLSARQREGARLSHMLQEHVAQLRALAAQAVPLVPQLVLAQRQRFMDRWNEAMNLSGNKGDSVVAPEAARDRALTEATAFAIRIDVAEEITRLNSHLDEIERLLKAGGETGKRLDFLIQELQREANTMGSKSAALELTHIAVDMKVLIEQMREQVQNLE